MGWEEGTTFYLFKVINNYSEFGQYNFFQFYNNH